MIKELIRSIWFSITIMFISYVCARIAFPESFKEYDLYVLGPISFLIFIYGFIYFITTIIFFQQILLKKINSRIYQKIKNLKSKKGK